MEDTNTQQNTNTQQEDNQPQQNTNTQQEDNQPQQNQQQANQTASIDYDKLAEIVAGKQSATEDSVLKGYFKQQGLSGDEVKQAIDNFKAQKKKNTPDVTALQSEIASARKAQFNAELEKNATLEAIRQGVDTKSIPYVLRMADFKEVADKEGSINAEKLSEAIKKVLEDVPALKGSALENDGIQKIGGDSSNQGSGSNPDTKTVPQKRWNRFNN